MHETDCRSSDTSALSEEAKVALARGAELAGTGICSGEGGMLAEEKAENSRYLYELASARFGWRRLELVENVQAFHFKGGQGAKTGTGGHLPGDKVQGRIAEVRGLEPGQSAISPATFPHLDTTADFRKLADEVRERSGGIPVGFELSANHIEDGIDFALESSADYIILDGRGGGDGRRAAHLPRPHLRVDDPRPLGVSGARPSASAERRGGRRLGQGVRQSGGQRAGGSARRVTEVSSD